MVVLSITKMKIVLPVGVHFDADKVGHDAGAVDCLVVKQVLHTQANDDSRILLIAYDKIIARR